MAIKWNGWTAHPVIKILSFIMIPVLLASSIASLVHSFYDSIIETKFELLFVDYANQDYFFDNQLRAVPYYASELARYESEEAIQNGEYLEWWSVGDEGKEYTSYRLQDTVTPERYSEVDAEIYENDRKLVDQTYQEAIQEQLRDYRRNKERLAEYAEQGLQYYIANNAEFSNTSSKSERYFTGKPAYYIIEKGMWKASSPSVDGWNIPDDGIIYLAYDQEAIDAITGNWQLMQADIWAKITMPIFMLLGALFCFVILIAGAGRRQNGEKGEINFTVWDKPYLDLSLVIVALFELALLTGMAEFYHSILSNYGSARQYGGFLSIIVFGICVPVLSWVLSAIKRFKAGKWWRHTLCYNVLSRLWGLVRRFCRKLSELWCGTAMAVKLFTTGAIILICCLFSMISPILCVPFGFAAWLVIVWYAQRLYLVREGAELASRGIYDPPIKVSRGELGEIAGSINNIAAGVSAAVEARMRSERMKTELITNVSHDIRTPLTSLITYTDLLQSEGLTSEKAPEYLEVLTQKTQRLKTLVEELFEAAKASTGNVDVNLEELDLSALIRQCLGELDERVQSSGLDFRLGLPDHAPVLADGKLIWRVMENLLGNVFKYAMAGSRVYIDVIETGAEYRLEVKNISAAPLNVDPDELTERFTRGDDARSGEGSGLGLSIVQSFVQVQGGRFQLRIDGDLFKATVWLPQPLI